MKFIDKIKGFFGTKAESESEKLNKRLSEMNLAYASSKEDSAFKWYNLCIVKPNTGSKEDIRQLHEKFKISLNWSTEEKQKEFILLVLADIDCVQKGYASKEECANKMWDEYRQLRLANVSNEKFEKYTPFSTITYWNLFDRE